MNEATESTPNQPPQLKQRHACLTVYLVLMIIANSATVIIYLVGYEGIRQNVPNMQGWAFPVLIAGGIFNLVCVIALFRWKKWGFWGFVCSAGAVFFVNLSSGINLVAALCGLLGVAILYGVLHIGQKRNGWTQLE